MRIQRVGNGECRKMEEVVRKERGYKCGIASNENRRCVGGE